MYICVVYNKAKIKITYCVWVMSECKCALNKNRCIYTDGHELCIVFYCIQNTMFQWQFLSVKGAYFIIQEARKRRISPKQKQKGIFFALNEPVEKVLGNTECNIPLITFIKVIQISPKLCWYVFQQDFKPVLWVYYTSTWLTGLGITVFHCAKTLDDINPINKWKGIINVRIWDTRYYKANKFKAAAIKATWASSKPQM